MTVKKNIEYGLKLKKLDKAEITRRIDEVVSFTQLSGLEDRLPGQLSGGQQQRVALARALAVRPNVLLLDEPLSNLDAQLRLEMRDNISRIHRQTGLTTIYVTHDQKEALSMGTAISVMRKGELIQSGTPRMLYRHPISGFIASFIGETNLLEGTLRGREGSWCLVDSPLGKIKATPPPASLSEGSKVHISMRPEALLVTFDRRPPTLENNFELKLAHLTYLGESEQFFLTYANKALLKSTIFHTPEHDLREGEIVYCGIAAADVLVLPFDESLAKTS